MDPPEMRKLVLAMPSHANRLAVVARVALVAYVCVSLPFFVRNVTTKLREASSLFGADLVTARAATKGEPYTRSIERIRQRIPKDGAYVLVADWEPAYRVRFDLAPRRALLFNEQLLTGGQELPESVRWVVVARDVDRPVKVLDAGTYFTGWPLGAPAREDNEIPGSLDEPAEGVHLHGPVTIRGWCQERGGRPCADVEIILDGDRLEPGSIERHPRPDVEAAVPGIGRCDRAGYSVVRRLDPDETGHHFAYAFLRTADGRYRRLGPRGFWWGP